MTRSEIHTKILEVVNSVKTIGHFESADRFLANYRNYYVKDEFDKAIAWEAFKLLYSKKIEY